MVYARYWPLKIKTFFNGQLVGKDEFDNKYYQEKRWSRNTRPRRWVIYKSSFLEASQISPNWYGWLHHFLDSPLENQTQKTWQKERCTNMTGSQSAYRPERHILKEGNLRRSKSYEAWTP